MKELLSDYPESETVAVEVINELLSKPHRNLNLFQIKLNLSNNSHSYLIVMLFP
jgi:hypothetical protein